uniref:Peptidase A1 domain-containing protein n=1 Tax=Ananas comosus var. bracteatus TaxID=296719 RepID=A0A6V7QS81_ANACO
MITEPDAPSFYFVGLVGLKVGGRNLSIPQTVFTKVGTIIDSGTVATYLPPTAYSALRDEFRRWMTRYRMRPPYAIFDTCYNFTGLNTTVIPIVTLEFSNGVAIDLPFYGIMYFIDPSMSQACLAFAATSEAGEFSIIGNVQQRSMEVVYDLERSMIGFSQDSC